MGYIDTKFAPKPAGWALTDQTVFGRNGPVKRLLDIAISGLALLFLLPLLLAIALIVKLTSKGPILYRQRRLGLNGKVFFMYKFCTMNTNGKALLDELLKQCPLSKAEWDKYQKLRRDPRITRPGRILRKTSLDELPQLLNVFLGSMSIVGLRPILPQQQDAYGASNYSHYVRARPGITGLWQVSGRNSLPFERRAELDSEYSANWSLKLDVKILIKTVPVILFSRGAF